MCSSGLCVELFGEGSCEDCWMVWRRHTGNSELSMLHVVAICGINTKSRMRIWMEFLMIAYLWCLYSIQNQLVYDLQKKRIYVNTVGKTVKCFIYLSFLGHFVDGKNIMSLKDFWVSSVRCTNWIRIWPHRELHQSDYNSKLAYFKRISFCRETSLFSEHGKMIIIIILYQQTSSTPHAAELLFLLHAK